MQSTISILSFCNAFVFAIIIITTVILLSTMRVVKGFWSAGLNNFHYAYRSSVKLNSIGRLIFESKPPKNIPHLRDIEKISDRVFRVLGLNPGSHTLQGTNTWLVTGTSSVTGSHVLIDTGEDVSSEKYTTLLFDKVFPMSGTKSLSKILLTHGHGDHLGGVRRILSELEKRGMLPLPTVHKRCVSGGHFPAKGFACEHISDHELFRVGDDHTLSTTIEALYTPGHTDDHVAFVIREDNALVSGDCVLGCGTTVFDNLHQYMHSLRKLRLLIMDRVMNGSGGYTIQRIYPGHGPVVTEPLQKIEEYIRHRELRETQITRALGQIREQDNRKQFASHLGGGGWMSSWGLVELVYGPLPLLVKVSAQHNVSHHLDKLLHDRVVEQRWPDMWRLRGNAKQ